MIKLIQKATASSKDGAVGLIKGIIACAFQNMAFMLPTGLLYYLVKDLLGGDMGGKNSFLHSRLRYMLCAYINYNLVSV